MKKVCASESNMKVAFINIIPAIIYAFVITGQLLGNLSFGIKAIIGIVFVIAYMALTLLPYTSFLVNIASAIMYIGLLWVICDKAGNHIIQILLKVVTAAFVALLEISIAINMTLKN